MNTRPRTLILILMLAALPLWNCSGGLGTAHVTIELGLPQHATFQAAPSAFERICAILPFFPTKAFAAPLVEDITGVTLEVSQGGASIFNKSFSPTTSSISADVPSGSGLTITATVIMDPANESAVLEYAGSKTVDLAAGDDVTIAISMLASETKIVIPDYNKGRVVQVTTMTRDDPWYSVSFSYPRDIAFDAQGRIYVAGANGLQRIDTIASAVSLTFTAITPVCAVAVDRAAGVVYFAEDDGASLRRSDLSDDVNVVLSLEGRISDITGLSVANDGSLYISGTDGGDQAIIHYNPSTEKILGTFTYSAVPPFVIPQHVLYRNSTVYAIYCDDNAGFGEIIALSPDLAYKGKAGEVNHSSFSGITSPPMVFHHPIHFVAVLNRKFTLMDNDTNNNSMDRIVSFDNLNGDNWLAYADMPSSTSDFDFYAYAPSSGGGY